MQKLVNFLLAILILGATGGMVWVAAAIYDTAQKQYTETYFFQPDKLSSQRIGVPVSPADLGKEKVVDLLLGRFVMEYFYVVPDQTDIENRTGQMGQMRMMTTNDVYNQWVEGEAQTIESMAQDGKMRMVTVNNIIRHPDSDYIEIEYSLKTWDKPNKFALPPIVTNHTMVVRPTYDEGIRMSIMESGIHNHFENGGDAAALFRFGVTAVE